MSPSYDSCVVPWCLYLRAIVCTDERGLLPMNDVKQRGTEFEGRPLNTSTGTPPIDLKYVNYSNGSF